MTSDQGGGTPTPFVEIRGNALGGIETWDHSFEPGRSNDFLAWRLRAQQELIGAEAAWRRAHPIRAALAQLKRKAAAAIEAWRDA